MSRDESDHFVIPPAVFYLLIGGAVTGGAGVSGALVPRMEADSLQSCYDNSRIALDVAAQHGQEILDIRSQLTDARRLIFDRTQYRFTSEDFAKYSAAQSRTDDIQNKRLDILERE